MWCFLSLLVSIARSRQLDSSAGRNRSSPAAKGASDAMTRTLMSLGGLDITEPAQVGQAVVATPNSDEMLVFTVALVGARSNPGIEIAPSYNNCFLSNLIA